MSAPIIAQPTGSGVSQIMKAKIRNVADLQSATKRSAHLIVSNASKESVSRLRIDIKRQCPYGRLSSLVEHNAALTVFWGGHDHVVVQVQIRPAKP